MLEQVREAGLAGLDFIARAGLHDDVHRDQVRRIRGDGDEPQAVSEILLRISKRKRLLRNIGSHSQHHSAKQEQERPDHTPENSK